MAKKIYISPSNQDANAYAYGNTNEMEQCNRIAEALEKHLKRNGYEVKRAPKGQDMDNLNPRFISNIVPTFFKSNIAPLIFYFHADFLMVVYY